MPRGLIGYFINASLTNQFEFLTRPVEPSPEFVKSATGPGGSSAGNAVFNISGQDFFLGVNDPSTAPLRSRRSAPRGRTTRVSPAFRA